MAALSATFLTNVKQRAEELYAENFQDLAFNKAEVTTVNAVLENQMAARAQQLLQAAPTDSVDVVWDTDDNGGVQDCTSDCSLTGTPATGDTISISAPKCIETVGWTVSEESARRAGRSVLEESAFLLARRMIGLDNGVNSYTAAQLYAKVDAPVAGSLPPYATFSAGVSTVPAGNYGLQMFADWLLTAIKNRMGTPYMIDNGALYTYLQNARLNSQNLNGQGDAARALGFAPYEDILGLAAAGITQVDDFFIKRGAVALFSKYFNTVRREDNTSGPITTPVYYGGQVQQWRSTMKSANITAGGGIIYDLFATETCADITGNTSHSDIGHTYKLKVNVGVVKAPGVGAARPGILAIKRGS